jgi:predicted ribosomally synthesized peptide with SipW-like signal peptide
MKKKILIVLVLVASVAMLATGAFAYFSSQTVNTGTITSGNLYLKVASGETSCGDYGDSTTVWSMLNMAPGDEISGFLCMKNTGNVDAKQVTFEWVYDPALKPLADRIIITSIFDSTDPGDQVAAVTGMCDTVAGAVVDGKCSLTELAYLSNNYGWPFDAYSGAVSPWLPAGGAQWLYMKLQFDPSAGNEFQNQGFNYTLKVTAWQNNVFP